MSDPIPEVFTPDNPPPFASWPSKFALQVKGFCCEPIIPDGANCIFDQDEPYQTGDFIAIWALRTNGVIMPMVKRLTMNVADWGGLPHKPKSKECVVPALVYESLNPPQIFHADLRAIWGIQKCVGYAPHSLIEIGDVVPHDDPEIHWFNEPVIKKPRRKRPSQTAAA